MGWRALKRFESLRIWRWEPRNPLMNSALSHCRDSQFTNLIRTDWICSMQQFSDRLSISSRALEVLPGTCTPLHRPKRIRRSCASFTQSTRKRKSTAFRNWATTCYAICENSYPGNDPTLYPELDGAARTPSCPSSD